MIWRRRIWGGEVKKTFEGVCPAVADHLGMQIGHRVPRAAGCGEAVAACARAAAV